MPTEEENPPPRLAFSCTVTKFGGVAPVNSLKCTFADAAHSATASRNCCILAAVMVPFETCVGSNRYGTVPDGHLNAVPGGVSAMGDGPWLLPPCSSTNFWRNARNTSGFIPTSPNGTICWPGFTVASALSITPMSQAFFKSGSSDPGTAAAKEPADRNKNKKKTGWPIAAPAFCKWLPR